MDNSTPIIDEATTSTMPLQTTQDDIIRNGNGQQVLHEEDDAAYDDDDDDDDYEDEEDESELTTNTRATSMLTSTSSFWINAAKWTATAMFLWSAVSSLLHQQWQDSTTTTATTLDNSGMLSVVLWSQHDATAATNMKSQHGQQQQQDSRRRLLEASAVVDGVPYYMDPLMKDLQDRKKLFEETPPEEIKYWFEYTGPLQKYFYRYSRSRQKADYFEGRDDSGVVSARFVQEPGGTDEYRQFYHLQNTVVPVRADQLTTEQQVARNRILDLCLAMGHPDRPNRGQGTMWSELYGDHGNHNAEDRCRVLFAMNTVGAGRGTTMLWETNPPKLHAEEPKQWTSEQENAVTHLERNLQEIDAMCATGLIAARLQVLVCEPIPAEWTEWMDSQLVHCGGKPWPQDRRVSEVEDRPSPLQIVVTASTSTADTCHDLKSGFMEKRMQDLLLAPPYLDTKKAENKDPTIKTTHPDLISSDDHDLYVGFKWSSLVTVRAVHSFLQASADIAAAASSPINQTPEAPETSSDGTVVTSTPSSPFLIPSFVRVSYVSEENSKTAKWRMHGDFFHPAAWEVCKDSFDMTWIPHSLAGPDAKSSICEASSSSVSALARKLGSGRDCGQWWLYFTELQMPTSPEVYANEVSPPPVQGGSNFIWMITERQRHEIVKTLVCHHDPAAKECPEPPQAVIPLGDLESFLINFTPNTALGKQHIKGRRPGYSHEEERELERQLVRERKQLHDIEEIEKALFDYTIYPAALFHKDATIKAARARDAILTQNRDPDLIGPQTVKSSYYDVTITKPRPPLLGWCQAIARRGLCTLYADYFRSNADDNRCNEACGFNKNFTPIRT